MDFPYLEKVAKLNIAALAAMASAPPPPEPTVEGAVSTDTTVSWEPQISTSAYRIRWRRTDAHQWQESRMVRVAPPASQSECGLPRGLLAAPRAMPGCVIALPHIRVDDWVFGVSSVSKDGFESPVASAVPGGAFKPWVAPVAVEKK